MVNRKRRRNARLDDGVAFHNAPFAIAETWPIERMRHRANQTNGSAPREARVCVERDHVANVRKVYRGTHTGRQKCSARRTAQELVQFVQLSSLALPAHPFAFALVPYTPAMEKKKAFAGAGGRTIFFVQPSDPIHCNGQKAVVTRQAFAWRVQPIREQ